MRKGVYVMFDFGNRSDMRGPERFTQKPQIVQSTTSNTTTGGIMGHLDKIQQFVNVVERTAPYIEEYGPFVKNLPQMYRMIKAFKSLGEDEEEPVAEKGNSKEESTYKSDQEVHVQEQTEQNISSEGISKPKLFI